MKLACSVEVGLRLIHVFVLCFLFYFFFLPTAPYGTGSCTTCKELDIFHRLTSVAHPQSDGEVEVMNRTLLYGLKAYLSQAKGLWVKEYRMTQRVPTGETPSKLTFETEAVISLEIGLPML